MTERIRQRARRAWPCSRDYAFAVGLPSLAILRRIFAALAPDRPLPADTVSVDGQTYNFSTDTAYLTPQDDGILIAYHCFGAVLGDGVDLYYHLVIGDELGITVRLGTDYTMSEIVFEVGATAELIDVTNDVLLQLAAEAGFAPLRGRADATR